MKYKKQKLALAILMGVGVSLFGCGGGGGGGGGGSTPSSPNIAPNSVELMNDTQFQNFQTSIIGIKVSAEVAADNHNKCIEGRDCLIGVNVPPVTTTDESETTQMVVLSSDHLQCRCICQMRGPVVHHLHSTQRIIVGIHSSLQQRV